MLTPDKLKEIQKKAREAVSDMPEGELKTKAFEVFLQHLLAYEVHPPVSRQFHTTQKTKLEQRKTSREPGTVKSRILLLKDEGFFQVPRTIADVKNELHAHGWIHPNTALSGPLQGLVRERHLRRVKDKVWKYVNP
jgi:hypothetical protein